MKYLFLLLTLFLSCESEIEVSQFDENRNSEEEIIVPPPSPLLLSASKSQLIGIESVNLNV